jgi:hypothetical protein
MSNIEKNDLNRPEKARRTDKNQVCLNCPEKTWKYPKWEQIVNNL